MSLESVLEERARASGVQLPAGAAEKCGRHFRLLQTWNKTHNLTRVVDEEGAARLHYLDGLVPLLRGVAPDSFVDVGSGAGFPGLMAALAWPLANAFLVEPARKRASFLQLAIGTMGLEGGRVVVAGDAKEVEGKGAVVMSRATFPPGKRQELVRYLRWGGQVWLWGHPHDAVTWQSEVRTWGFAPLPPVSYRIEGLEERCILRAEARAAGDVSRGTDGSIDR